jgi:signal transduction histidine kinase
VEVPKLCGQNWSLWAWDPENETYRNLLLPRQLILVASCSGSIILVVGLAYLFLRRKGREAQRVLAQIRDGILGSRLPNRFWEPRLALVTEFNRMAAAVEDSFARLREMEERRTPLASLRAAAETLSEFHQQLAEEQRQNLHQTLMLDVVYFQRLIDDLLILAQVDRLDTTPPQQASDLLAILDPLWSRMRDLHPQLKTTFSSAATQPRKWLVPGDESLVRRLLQNTLDNAFHYAQSSVHCELLCQNGRLILRISNDAQPLPDEALQNWGHKRRQRIITEKAGQPHTSLGLGSSIIVGVSRHLGGSARMEQIRTPATDFAQITVTIELPEWKAHA